MSSLDLLEGFGPREAMDYDVVIVGGGPPGLATAIRVKRLKPDASVVVLEKSAEPGAHIQPFAAQGLAVLRELGLADDDPPVNPNGGAIALGHPPGMSGARLITTAINQLHRISGRYALCTTCIGVGQGIAIVVERV